MTTILGCVADDLTGATDLALVLSQNGMRTILVLDTPATDDTIDADAVVVALKTRTMNPDNAARLCMQALDWLKSIGAERIFFKYCSTFDSTESGNIGPVAEAMAARLMPDFTVFCPAFPANRRTVYQGHLFVEGRLLSESSLASHPLTPMKDPDLVRVLQKQCKHNRVGLIPLETVEKGTAAILEMMENLRDKGCRFGIVDALDDDHLRSIADACASQPLMTGGSAVTAGLPAVYRLEGRLAENSNASKLDHFEGTVAVLSGSCSETSQQQVSQLAGHYPAIEIDPLALARGSEDAGSLLQQAGDLKSQDLVLFFSTAPAPNVAVVQSEVGRWQSGELIEEVMADLAEALVARGVKKLIVAGGETSGAVARKLELGQLRVGPEIDPGVPWMQSTAEPKLLLSFKSGNFGGPDFFTRAAEMVS